MTAVAYDCIFSNEKSIIDNEEQLTEICRINA